MSAAVSSLPGSPSSAISVPPSPFRMAMGDGSACLVDTSAVGVPTPTPSPPSSAIPSVGVAVAATGGGGNPAATGAAVTTAPAAMLGPSPSHSPTPAPPDFSVAMAPCSSSDHQENGALDSRGDQERSSENKRKRNPNWKVHEVLALIEAKRIEKERQQSGGYREQMKMAEERWAEVEQYLIGHDIERDAEQARRKWENLVSDYKTIREWNRRSAPCQVYWDLSPAEKRDHKLPVSMDEVVFHQMDDVHGGGCSGGGGGGGGAVGGGGGGGGGGGPLCVTGDKTLSLVAIGPGGGPVLASGLGTLVPSGTTRVSASVVDMAVPVATAVTVAAVPGVSAGGCGSIVAGVRCMENGGNSMTTGCLATGVTVDRMGSSGGGGGVGGGAGGGEVGGGGGNGGGAVMDANAACRAMGASVSSMTVQGGGCVPGSPGGSIMDDPIAMAKKKRKKFQGMLGGGVGEHHYHHPPPGATHEMAQMMLHISSNLKDTCRKMDDRRDVTAVVHSDRSGEGLGVCGGIGGGGGGGGAAGGGGGPGGGGAVGGYITGSAVKGHHHHQHHPHGGMGQVLDEAGATSGTSPGVIGVLAHLASALNKLAEQETSTVISVLDQLAAAVNKLAEKV